MNTDERGLKTRFLSAFIRVHRRPKVISSQLLTVAALKAPTHHARPVGHIQTWRQPSLDRDPANPRPQAGRAASALAQFLPQSALD